MALLFTNAQTALKLLLHDRVLGDKAGRETSQTDLLDSETISSGQRKSRGGRVAVECVLGEVEFTRSGPSVAERWGARLLLDDNFGCVCICFGTVSCC